MLSVFFSFQNLVVKVLTHLAFILLALSLNLSAGAASEVETDFLARLQGNWSGTGRVLAGPDKGTSFKCSLSGKPSRTGVKISMDGKCSIGRLSARKWWEVDRWWLADECKGEYRRQKSSEIVRNRLE